VRFWLEAPGSSTETCRAGHALLARIFAMEGAPVGLSGRERGLILLDATAADGWAPAVARQLHWLLQALTDTEIRAMGGTSVLVGRGETPIGSRMPASARPRLLVPAVAAAGLVPAYVLVLSSGRVLDLEDALAEPWADRLIAAVPAGARAVFAGLETSPAALVPIDPRRPDEALRQIVAAVLAVRFRGLGTEAPEELEPWLEERSGLSPAGVEGFWQWCLESIVELDSVGWGDADAARRILCAIRWRARACAPECVERLRAWQDDARYGELAGPVAGAAARMLFKMIGLGGWHPSMASHGCLFELAIPLATEDWSGAQTVLQAARRLIVDDGWRKLLCGRPNGVLLPCLGQIACRYPAELEETAAGWASSPDETEMPQAVRGILEEMRRAAVLGERRSLPPLPPGGSYRVLALDAHDEVPQQLQRAAQVAADLLNDRSVRDDPEHPWVIFRLGCGVPLARPSGRYRASDLLAAGRRRPRLLHPLLDALPREAVELVLVVATGPLVDEADLAESAWLPKVHCYFTDERWRRGGLLAQVPWRSEARGISPVLHYLAAISGPKEGSSIV
nr:hypothetical protein [Acidobacteriota bacterium]